MHQRQLGGLWAAFVSAIVGTIVITACGGGGGGSDTEHREMPSARGGGGNGGGGGGGGSSAGVALTADARVRSLDLGWSDNGASQYNVYLSSSPNCDIAKYTLCADAQMLANVRPPLHVEGLVNGRAYYAKVEGIYSKTRSVSNEAGTKPNSLAFNDSVWALATAADGTTYLGGDFTKIGITSGQGMTLDATSGRPSVAGFPVIGGGGVIAATPDGSGGWYIGGDFLRVGTTSKKYLAHMRADGSLDANWTPQPDGTVRTIAVMNGVVYVGGTFSTINGQKRIGLAAIDAAGGFLTAWNPDPDLGVWTIAAANNTIYVGGPFNTVGAFRRGYLAAIDTFGNVLAWDPVADNSVETLAVANGIVYAGGFFESVSGQPRAKLAAIDAASGKPTAWNPGSQPCATCDVKAIAMVGNTLYVGGRFTQIGSTPRNALAAIDAASGSVLAWNPDADQTVQSLSVLNDATRGTIVYAGGMFSTIGGQPRSYLAAIDAQGALLPWQPAPNATVDVVAAAGNAVYAGGRFTGLGAVTRNRLAALDAKGNLTTWNPDADQSVLAFAISRDTIYVGGNFTTLGGQPRAHIALVDTAGSVSAWNPGTDGAVRAFAVGGSGNVYVGGEFTHIAGAMFNRLAAIGPTGALLGWTPNADRPVLALAVRPDTGQGVGVCGRTVLDDQRPKPPARGADRCAGTADGVESLGLRDRR